MNLRSAAALVVLAGCATTPSTSPAPASEPTPRPLFGAEQKVTNVIPFDLAACAPRELSLSVLNPEVLTGALLSLSPAFQECFILKESRDGQPFDLKAKVTARETTTVEFSGTGATDSGKACVEAAIKRLAFKADSAPATAELPVNVGPQTLSFGDNAANDVAGRLRVAQLQQCVCYEKLGPVTPPSLTAAVEVDDQGKATVAIGREDEFSKCLSDRFGALELGKEPVKLKWPLLLKNSYVEQADPAAPAALRFAQLEGIRGQRTADMMIAAGRRLATALEYDAMAKDFKRKPSKGFVDKLKNKCAEVIGADDVQITSVKALIGVLEQSQQLVQQEKVKEPQWAQLESAIAQQLTSSTGEVVRLEAQRKSDEGACPKTKLP